MRKGESAELKMQKMLRSGEDTDITVHKSIFLRYDDKQECIYLALQESKLTDLSLDGIYQCEMKTETGKQSCIGRIKERYDMGTDAVVKLQIENGFYKI